MTKPTDDLEAVRVVAEALQGFDAKDQERIIRWAREKLGLSTAPVSPHVSTSPPQSTGLSGAASAESGTPATTPTSPAKDLKTFVADKKPKNDVQFAATVAYFYRFEAPQTERRNEITSDDLQDACRLAGRKRLIHSGQTLRNAVNLGLLDKSGRGAFTINSVGENLVAMTLPQDTSASPARKARDKKASRRVAKRTPPKKSRK